MTFYDRQGNRISAERWSELLADEDYKRVAATTLRDGTLVSTVWMGLDREMGGRRQVFETMVFAAGTWDEQLCHRHATEAEALADHDQVVASINDAYDRLKSALDEIEASQE